LTEVKRGKSVNITTTIKATNVIVMIADLPIIIEMIDATIALNATTKT
jgi:hypothetical protein